MQFAVPQFTDVEDKIIGPLTIKQFLVLVVAGGFALLFWSVLPKALAILIDIPIALVGIGLAFGSYNGRAALTYIIPFVNFLMSPKFLVFKRESNVTTIETAKPQPKPEPVKVAAADEAPDSRLKKLAYLLDQKTEQEKELIDKTITAAADAATLAATQPSFTAKMQSEGQELLSKLAEPKITRPVIENTDRVMEMRRVIKKQEAKAEAAVNKTAKAQPRPMGVSVNQRSILDD